MSFKGFTKEALRFLFENKLNNSKEWYDDHKADYKNFVYNPFVELVEELSPAMKEIDESFITVPSKIISRVRRDTRFTKDKSLYRDNVWIVFLRDKSRMATSACYWFELGQKGTSYGVGYYGAETSDMAAMRELILENHPAFQSAQACYERQSLFTLGGESYKRSRYPEKPEALRQWLDKKNIYFEAVQPHFDLAYSKDLPQILKRDFQVLKPVYDFLLACGARSGAETIK